MLPVFVRHAQSAEDEPSVVLPADLVGTAGLSPSTMVALTREGPFFPLAVALAKDGALRDLFAESLALPALAAYRRVRAWMFLGLVPILMLAELDRELGAAGMSGAWSRLAVDFFLAVATTADLSRKTPRHPRTTALVFAGAAARYAFLLARTCARGVSPILIAAPLVAIAVAVLVIWQSPSPRSIAEASLARLGIAGATNANPPPNAQLAASLAAGLGLPLLLFIARQLHLGVWPQGGLFVIYSAIIPPMVVRRSASVLPPWPRIALGFILGFALTVGLTNLAHYGVDAIAYVLRCLDPAGFEHGTVRKLLAAESGEVKRGIDEAREKWAFLVMTVFVVPIVEERVYRGLLQRIFARRYGAARAIALASVVFAVAHLGVYRVALYQTVLLGIAFGAAFEEGGLVAAVLVHMMWNLYLLL
ncbi:MAG: CPBP family intramembrane glutamic endopeptidase [Polyangiaceae bacterium]